MKPLLAERPHHALRLLTFFPHKFVCLFVCGVCLLGALVHAAVIGRSGATRVDLALVLGVDISNSVNWFEYQHQRHGLAYAINHPEVIAAIQRGGLGRIAVTVVQWSGEGTQRIAIPWTFIADQEGADQLSRQLEFMPRLSGGHATHISGMIAFGNQMLQQTPFVPGRKVIDISGDGVDNVSKIPGRERDSAIAAGITINGLAIENEEPELRHYFRDFVIGGPGAFVLPTKRYDDFGEAMKAKLIREIGPAVLSHSTGPPNRG